LVAAALTFASDVRAGEVQAPAPDPQPQKTTLFGVPRCTSKQLCWSPNFDRMDWPEVVLTGVASSIALATNIIHPLNTGWTGGILFDNQVRQLRLGSIDAQYEARSASDLGLALMVTYPILVDSLIVAYWYRGSADVGLQMGLIDMEAFAIVGAIEGTTNIFTGRARPYGAECGTTRPANTADCATDALNRSFFSGHTAMSFTSAALICAHHEALHLFDSGWDHVMCAGGFVAASAVGLLRILGDAHYFSDVFVGAVIGTTVGLTVPLLHHYGGHNPMSAKRSSSFRVDFVPGLASGSLVGTF
jgi:membrane-associated phospholipid phosphatase